MDRLLNAAEVAEFLGLAQATVRCWRRDDSGPPFVRFGPNVVRYRKDELEEWVNARNEKNRRHGGAEDVDAAEWTLSSLQVAEILGMSGDTLRTWRREGRGPLFIRISKNVVRYRKEDVEQWLKDGRTCCHHAETH